MNKTVVFSGFSGFVNNQHGLSKPLLFWPGFGMFWHRDTHVRHVRTLAESKPVGTLKPDI